MPVVTGVLSDFGLATLAAFNPEIVFTPSGPAISATRLLATKPIKVTPDPDGSFSLTLAPTNSMHPVTWYTISVQWLDSAGGYIGIDFPDWQLFIDNAGGNIIDLLNIPANPAQVWVSTTAPDNPTPGLWWLNPTTGDLYEWSN